MSDDSTAARAEWRAEETRWSIAALEQWEHTRELADVARDAMHRGDDAGHRVPIGRVLRTDGCGRRDVVRIVAGRTAVDIRLDPAAPFVLRVCPSPDDGRRGDATVTTFAARLRELDGTLVSIGLFAGSLEGTLRVGRGQMRLVDADGGCAYVPTGSIWWARPLDDD